MTGRKNIRRPGSNPIGRPTTVTPAVQDGICDIVAKGGTVREYCNKHKHVGYATVFNYMASESGEKFREAFARAREIGTHAMAEQCVEIADEKGQDQMRARLRVDTRLRLIGQWNRKTYGPKQDIDLTNRVSLGELVEASMRIANERAQLVNVPAPMLDITPANIIRDPNVVISPRADEIATADAELVRAPQRARKPRRAASS